MATVSHFEVMSLEGSHTVTPLTDLVEKLLEAFLSHSQTFPDLNLEIKLVSHPWVTNRRRQTRYILGHNFIDFSQQTMH